MGEYISPINPDRISTILESCSKRTLGYTLDSKSMYKYSTPYLAQWPSKKYKPVKSIHTKLDLKSRRKHKYGLRKGKYDSYSTDYAYRLYYSIKFYDLLFMSKDIYQLIQDNWHKQYDDDDEDYDDDRYDDFSPYLRSFSFIKEEVGTHCNYTVFKAKYFGSYPY